MDLAFKIERLAADLRAISDGSGPTHDELAEAPLLLNWHLVPIPAVALGGLVLDHPRLGTTRVTTSMVYAISPDKLWARTLSRYYRFQPPA
jgi:hypothetical protein